jgi:L-ascorbate metabolism protein UlaG (beta-lactamase superfamily)
MLKRRTPMPIDPNLLKGIDYVLLSHGHFDHCDKKSLRLLQQLNPNMEVLTGLNMQSLLHSFDKNIRLQEAGWYQQYRMNDGFTITYMPAKHWYNRTNLDKNKRLWGSFVIQHGGKTIYFMGDSGAGSHFTETATFFPDIDVCIMGVGAYKPENIMQSSHLSPQQALEAFSQLKGKRFIPMHYATFDLADEPMGEPYRILEKQKQAGDDRILLPALGEVIIL